MTDDERFQRDVTLGKRIGLYKFRGELGTGNFSRVKLAFHQLAHGKWCVFCLVWWMIDRIPPSGTHSFSYLFFFGGADRLKNSAILSS